MTVARSTGLALIAGLWLVASPASAQSRATGSTLVVPFDGGTDPRGAWLGEAVAMLMADDLNGMGGNAFTRDERVRAFERLHVPSRARLTHGTIIKIGQLIGASRVVSGRLDLVGDTLTMSVEAIRVDAGRLSDHFDERGPLSDLLATIERAARRLSPGSTVPASELERQHPPLAAYENFVKGLLAETTSTSVGFLEKAIALAPGFDRARLALSTAQGEAGDWNAARTAALDVPAGSPFKRRAEFLASRAELNLQRYDEAFARLRALADRTPAPEIFNNLGVIQLRRGATPQTGRATYFFNKAVELDPASVDETFNLGYAYLREKDSQAAIYWLREVVRRETADADAHFVLAAALDATGAATEAGRERELARRLSADYERARDAASAQAALRGLERVAEYLRAPARERREDPDCHRAARTAPDGELPPAEGPAVLRERGRPRGPCRAPARHLPGAVPGRGAPAGRPHPPQGRPSPGGDRGTEDRDLERRDRGGARRPRAGLPPGRRDRSGQIGGRARARPFPRPCRGRAPARSRECRPAPSVRRRSRRRECYSCRLVLPGLAILRL